MNGNCLQNVEEAEQALLLADYCAAERHARTALSHGAPRDLADRACVVAQQALFETQRFELAHRLMRDCFGSLAAAPPNSLLLWLCLAIDTDSRREAERLTQELLDACQPGSPAGWTRRQYLALLQLYVFHVLLPELREPAEVMRWVQETELPLTAEERQLLLGELLEEQAQLAQQAQRAQLALAATSRSPPAWQRRGSAAGGTAVVGALAPAWPGAGGGQGRREADEGHRYQQQQGAAGQVREPSKQAGPAQNAGGGGPVPAGEEIVPAEGGGGEPRGLDWLGRCQQQLLVGVSGLLHTLGMSPEQLLQRMAEADGGAPPAGAPPPALGAVLAAGQEPALALRQLSRTVLGCVLLYAAYAERRAIKRGVRSVQRFVGGGVGDLLRMAFSLTVSPMAVAAP